jgi:hypothetical protein
VLIIHSLLPTHPEVGVFDAVRHTGRYCRTRIHCRLENPYLLTASRTCNITEHGLIPRQSAGSAMYDPRGPNSRLRVLVRIMHLAQQETSASLS